MKTLKRLSLILAAVMTFSCCFGLFASAANVDDFTDVPAGEWYYDDVAYAVEHNMVNGTSTTTFSPNDTMTRGMFVTVLGRALSDGTASGDKFTDVPKDEYYYSYVYWAAENGITTGATETTFEPEENISRQQIAAMVGRAIQNLNLDVPKQKDTSYSYSDQDAIEDYAKAGVQTCWETGLMTGDSEGTFRPTASITRCEGTAVLVRLIRAISADPEPSPDPEPTPDPEPSTEPDTGKYSIEEAMAAGNARAVELGFVIDDTMIPNLDDLKSNTFGFYPGDMIFVSYLDKYGGQELLNKEAMGSVDVTYKNISAPHLDGTVENWEGGRMYCYITYNAAKEMYIIWVTYG